MRSIDISMTLSSGVLDLTSLGPTTLNVELRKDHHITSRSDCYLRTGEVSTESERVNMDSISWEGPGKMNIHVYCIDSDEHFNESAAKDHPNDFSGAEALYLRTSLSPEGGD